MSKNLQELLDELEVDAKLRSKVHEQETLKKERNHEMLKWFFTFLLPMVGAGFIFFEGVGTGYKLMNQPSDGAVLAGIIIGLSSLGLVASIIAWVFTYATNDLPKPPTKE